MRFIAFLISIAAICCLMSGCDSVTEKYYDNISEIRDNLYEGKSDTLSVTAVSGVREQPFAVDLTVNPKVDFTVITVTPAQFIPNRIYNYSVDIGGKTYSGVLTMHPFGETFSVEIDARAAQASLSFNIKQGGYEETIELISVVSQSDIDSSHALDTALKALSEDLKPLKKGGGYDCEIYVRIIPNPINNDGGYYWYVAFMGENTYAVLIDMKTAAVIGVKN